VYSLRLPYRFRAIISCVLAVSLCGASLGLRGRRDTAAAAALRQGEAFRYSGFAREAFPALIGPFLRAGKYNPFLSAASPAFPVPELGAGYVPQGMCYSQALGCFALAYYHPDKRPGLLALVDAESGAFVKSVYLLGPGGMPYTGHAGGAAAWGEHLWVTSDGRAWRLAAEDLRRARNGDTVRFRDSFRSASRGGFAFVAEGMLWLGDSYAHERSRPLPADRLDPGSGNRAWCVGYPLREGSPTGTAGTPAAVLSIQDCVQGACVASTGEFLASVSFTGAAPSWMWIYPTLRGMLEQPPAREVTVEKRKCPLWVVAPAMATGKQMLAPMSEGICAYDGKIYTWYESAALLYRGKAEMYADYVFALGEGEVLGG
jgi:hypothetical protein